LNSGEKKISYKPFSIALKYVVEEKKLEESLVQITNVFNLKLTELKKKTFLSKNGGEIGIPKPDGKPDEVILSKVSVNEKLTVDYFRNHLAGFIQQLVKEEVRHLHIFLPKYISFKDMFDSEEYFYQTFVEGILYGNYSFNDFKSEKNELRNLSIYFHAEDDF